MTNKKSYKQRVSKKPVLEKDTKCIACNGTGYYDNTGSPQCSACGGTGKESVWVKETRGVEYEDEDG